MNKVFLPKTYSFEKTSCVGSNGKEPIYCYRRNKETGKQELYLKEFDDLYSKIQSYKDDCNIDVILNRATNGDISMLDKNKSFYSDISEFPQNIHDYFSMEDELRYKFDGLPVEDKGIFDNDFNVFVNTIQGGKLNAKISEFQKKHNLSRKNISSDFNDSANNGSTDKE